jgi:dienelactone hydrolase
MATHTGYYQHLGVYSDWVQSARVEQTLYPVAPPGPETQNRFREILGSCNKAADARDVQVEDHWESDGVEGEAVSWSVGYGPRTAAWILKPAGASTPLPGIVALHDHGGFKFYGKEKIADGPLGAARGVQDFRDTFYGGRAYANALAKEGFVVLVHDTFLWGSRRFPLEVMERAVGRQDSSNASTATSPADISLYNNTASLHEHTVSKYCNLLGTTLAGMVCYEDRVATNYLRTRGDVAIQRIGCAGLSGGGNRATMLLATHPEIQAAVVVGLMTTYEELLDKDLSHTWMMFPFNWAKHGDWPDVAACRAPLPLLVQYDLDDDLFTVKGMRDADSRIAGHYQHVGRPDAYTGQFYPGAHKFDLGMQAAAFEWLKARLQS